MSTPKPVVRYKLTINDRLVYGEEDFVSMSLALIRVQPAPDTDGAYLAGTVVTLRALPRKSGYELIWNGVDSQQNWTATVRLNGDKSVEVLIGAESPMPSPTSLPAATNTP